MKLNKLLFTLALLLCFVVGQNVIKAQGVEGLRKPAQLFVDHETSDSNAMLYWWNPGDPTWLFHYNSQVQGLMTFGVGNFEIAMKFDTHDLVPYHGMSMTTLAFVGGADNISYQTKVWSGANGSELEYEQDVTTVSTDDWTYVEFTEPLVIDSSKTYYVGLAFETLVESTSGVGVDYGPSVTNKGNLIRNTDGGFSQLTDYVPDYDYNWTIALYIEDVAVTKSAETITFNQIDKTISTEVLSVENKEIEQPDFESKTKSATVNYFNIYRNNEIVGTSDTAGYHDILSDGGIFVYEVSAVYDEGESNKSNSYSIMYDNNRIPKNIMVLESFINTCELTDEQLSSPGSPGVVKGQNEMDFRYDVANIAYHSATEILGYDPFAFLGSEDRFMQYFMKTLAFPAMHFNGNEFLGGGQSGTMYFAYKDVYESILNIKTPVAQTSYIEGVSANKFLVHSDYELVGVYNLENTVTYTVLTESNIEYEWGLGEFEEVNFVAREFLPDINGGSINFEEGKASVVHELNTNPLYSKENYTVITFIQDTSTLEILNASKLYLPKTKVFTFIVNHNEIATEDVAVAINDDIIYTDKSGEAKIALFENVGDVNYTITHDGFNTINGTFNTYKNDTIQVDISLVGVESPIDFSIKAYPNPTTNVVFLKANSGFNFQLTDLSGKVIYSNLGNVRHYELNMSDYKPGVYVLKIQQDGKEQFIKILKQ